jgi:hypothetical protein
MQVKYKFHAHNPSVYITTKHVANYNILPGHQAILLVYFTQTQNIASPPKGLLAHEISGPYSNLLNTALPESECM